MPEQQDWFAHNAPKSAASPPGGDWFAANAPKFDAPTKSLHDFTDNPNHEGLYRMKDERGNLYGIPYSSVEKVDDFRNNFVDESEAKRYEKDQKAATPDWRDKVIEKISDPHIDPESALGRMGDTRTAKDLGLKSDATAEEILEAKKKAPLKEGATGHFLSSAGAAGAGMVLHPYETAKQILKQTADSVGGFTPTNVGGIGGEMRSISDRQGRARRQAEEIKKDPVGAAGSLAGQIVTGEVIGDFVPGAAKAIKEAPENIAENLKNRAGTGVRATEKLVRDTAAKNDELIAKGKTEGEKAHAEKVQGIRDENERAVVEHEQATKDRNTTEEKRVKLSRKAAELRTRLHNHLKDIHQSATDYFTKQYDTLGELTKDAHVDFHPLVEAVEEAKLQDIAGSDTKVPVFEDIFKRAKGEMGAGGEHPPEWPDMSGDERIEWAKQQAATRSGITYKDLTGYHRELGKLLRSSSIPSDVKGAIVRVRGVIEKMQGEAARLADEQAAAKAAKNHTSKPPSAAQLNYSIAAKYKNFAESYRDPGAVGTKAVNADNAVDATKPFIDAKTTEDLSELKQAARGKEGAEGKGANATDWAGRNSVSDTEGKRLTRGQRRVQTEKLIEQTRKAHEELKELPKPSPPPEPPELTPEPEYVPPKPETLNEDDLTRYKREQLNKKIDSLEANGMRIGVRGIGTIGLAELFSHLMGGGNEATGLIAGAGVTAAIIGPKIMARLLKMPGVAEKLLTISRADVEALEKLPANRRADVDQIIISLTQTAKMSGKIKPSDPTPLAKYAKADLDKQKAATKIVEKEVVPADEGRGVQAVDLPVKEETATPEAPSTATMGEQANMEGQREARTAAEATGFVPPKNAPSSPTRAPLRRLEDLHLDPQRFQYKLGGNKAGITDALSDVEWDQSLADPIHTWVDPGDGKEYVVNGHHRYDLAKKAGAEHIEINQIDNTKIKTASEARKYGALKNIADGNGTSVDAAKFFRESGLKPEDLKKYNISLKKATASEGLAMARLDDAIFDRVVDGRLDPKIAAAIGEATDVASDQEAIIKELARQERAGVKVTPDQIRESARLIKSAPSFRSSTMDLFGEHNETRNLFMELGEVSDHIQKQLATEKRAFGSVSKEGTGSLLERTGNKTNPAANAAEATRLAQQRELYSKRSAQHGPISRALQDAAQRIAEGEDTNAVKKEAYDEIRDLLADELGETN